MNKTTSNTQKTEHGFSRAHEQSLTPSGIAGPRLLTNLLALMVLLLAALVAFPIGATTTEEVEAYGFVSSVDGDALLSGLEGDDAIDAEVNHPLLTGDQLTTNSGRVELVLPDGTVIRVGRGTSVVFDSLAGAPDSETDGGSVIFLDQGELQIRTPTTFLGEEDLVIQTPNATVYLAQAGTYRIDTQSTSFTEVVVRQGFAEAVTNSGSEIAREDESLEISGQGRPFVNVVAAGAADSLELWAEDLDQAADSVSADVDPRLAYAAAPLEDAGEWVEVDSRRAWRPYVRADWRPFRNGRWVYTPSGLTWVASAPWGWVTSHYGSWDYVPGYGWLWLPGNVYMPAGVYWYWGPTHVAWVPYGYYNRYSRAGYSGYPGYRYGVYGWAGGDWGYWADWTFCPTRYFGRRGYDRYWDSGRNLARERRFAVPRGIVTTDTRGLGPDRWGKPTEVLKTLVRRVDPEGRVRSLPDITGHIERGELANVRETQAFDRQTANRDRLRPLPEERRRGRLTTRSFESTSRSISSGSGVRRIDSTSSGGRGRTVRRLPGAGVTSRSGSGSEDAAGFESRSGGELRRPDTRVRSVAGRRFEPRERATENDRPSTRPSTRELGSSLDRSVRDRGAASSGASGARRPSSSSIDSGIENAPARRVLERIRAHRETTRSSSSDSRGKSSSASPPSKSSRPQARSNDSKGSSKAPTRSSSSSARSSGSNKSSAQKSSPPSRSSGKRSSGSRPRRKN